MADPESSFHRVGVQNISGSVQTGHMTPRVFASYPLPFAGEFLEQLTPAACRRHTMKLFTTGTGHVLEFQGPAAGLELELYVERQEGVLLWFWLSSQSGGLLSYGRAPSA